MVVPNEPIKLGMWNLVWKKITIIPTNSVWSTVYESRITSWWHCKTL